MNARSTTNRRWGRTTLVTVAAFLGILAIGGSVALATIPGSGGAISACYNTGSNPSGQLRVIDADAGVTCSKTGFGVLWPKWYWVNRKPPITLASAAGMMSSTNLPRNRVKSGAPCPFNSLAGTDLPATGVAAVVSTLTKSRCMILPSWNDPFGCIIRPRFFKRAIEFQTFVLGGRWPGLRNFRDIPPLSAPKY